jgi:hypothetical protein
MKKKFTAKRLLRINLFIGSPRNLFLIFHAGPKKIYVKTKKLISSYFLIKELERRFGKFFL